MLEYLLFLPLVIFGSIFAIVGYRQSKNKKLALVGIIAFLFLILLTSTVSSICRVQTINSSAKSSLSYYLSTFNKSSIHTSFMCSRRFYKLFELHDKDNKTKIIELYNNLNSDGKITYSEAHELSIKTGFLYNLEKERQVSR